MLYYLSGLTCDDQNFITKACAQRKASELGIALVSPDTSPRANVSGENDEMEVGSAASFYLNATEGKWKKNYQMYDYIVKELPSVLKGLGNLKTDKVGHCGSFLMQMMSSICKETICKFMSLGGPRDFAQTWLQPVVYTCTHDQQATGAQSALKAQGWATQQCKRLEHNHCVQSALSLSCLDPMQFMRHVQSTCLSQQV